MTKPTITRLFLGSIVAAIAGGILTLLAIYLAFVNGVLIMEGPDVVGVAPGAVGWTSLALAVIGGLAVLGGFIGGLVAWIGALVNTAELEDKTWFIILLVLGLLSFGFIAMIAYIIAGPDGYDESRRMSRRVERGV